ncbi:MAG: diguanylate cyclase, partial [bacterium]
MSNNILLIENDPEIAQKLQATIEDLGYSCSAVLNQPTESIKYIDEHEVGLVLLDVHVDGYKDGITTIKRLREQSRVPVIFLTDAGDPQIQEEVKSFENTPLLQRPFEPGELDHLIEKVLAERVETTQSGLMNLLFIENDPGDARLVERYCESIDRWDVNFLHTPEIEEGLDVLRNRDVDVLLLDYYLDHDQTAVDVIGDIMNQGKDIPIIVLSGRGDEELAAEVLREGADDYRSKDDLNAAELVNAIRFVRRKFDHESKLLHKARKDELTGLYNRQHFMERFQEELNRSARYDNSLSLALVDIDDFKSINDKFGHLAGDNVLEGISDIILETIRDSDFSGRYGGDEIAVLLTQTDSDGAKVMAHRIHEKVSKRTFQGPDGESFDLTISVGVAEFDGTQRQEAEEKELEDLVNRADQALYLAKQDGKDDVERRRDPRYTADSQPVTIKTGDREMDGVILDYSENGARVEIPERCEQNRCKLIVEIDSETYKCDASVQWVAAVDPEGPYEMGLSLNFPVDTLRWKTKM